MCSGVKITAQVINDLMADMQRLGSPSQSILDYLRGFMAAGDLLGAFDEGAKKAIQRVIRELLDSPAVYLPPDYIDLFQKESI